MILNINKIAFKETVTINFDNDIQIFNVEIFNNEIDTIFENLTELNFLIENNSINTKKTIIKNYSFLKEIINSLFKENAESVIIKTNSNFDLMKICLQLGNSIILNHSKKNLSA